MQDSIGNFEIKDGIWEGLVMKAKMKEFQHLELLYSC